MSDADPTPPTAAIDADRRIADLMEVLEVSRRLAATTEVLPLLEAIERAALRVLDCERATVFLFDRESDELVSHVATGVGEIRVPAARGIVGECVRTNAVINVADAYNDARFNPEVDRRTGFRTRNMLTFPLVGYDNSIVGVLQVLNKRHGSFNAWDEELVHTFGSQAGVAVQRQLLLAEFAEKQRLQRDLDIAREIQQALLPQEPPAVPGFDLAGWSCPADETGGDCFDFLKLDDGHVAITIADATGHGIGPALVIAECRALFRGAVSLTSDLPRVATLVNRLLCDDLPDNRFVTAYFGLLRPEAQEIAYISAGHGPILFFDAAGGELRESGATGLPLGILDDALFDAVETIAMRSGDMLLLLTDGFFEWTDPSGEQFGTARVADVLRRHRALSAGDIIAQMHRAVLEFAQGTPQKDDLTAVVVKRV